jgi:hypothetical protein
MRFRKTLASLTLTTALVFALSAWAQHNVSPTGTGPGMVGRSARAELKFSVTTAISSDARPAAPKKPLNQIQVFALLAGQVPSHRVTMLVQERGIDFEPTDDYLQEVHLAGDENELISALKSAKVTKPLTVDPAAQARQAGVRQHMARAVELEQKGQYAEAEQEYRAAYTLDSNKATYRHNYERLLQQVNQ